MYLSNTADTLIKPLGRELFERMRSVIITIGID